MIRRKYLLLFVVSFALLLVGCDNDLGYQSPDDEWTAETLVSEADVERSGVDAWFRSETISDQIFSRMWLKSWKEDCPLNRSELRYLKVLHRNADGNPQRGEMVVNAAIADKAIWRTSALSGWCSLTTTMPTMKVLCVPTTPHRSTSAS